MTNEKKNRKWRRSERGRRIMRILESPGDFKIIGKTIKYRTGRNDPWQTAPNSYFSRPGSRVRGILTKKYGPGLYLVVQDPEIREVQHFYRDRRYIGTQNSHLLREQEQKEDSKIELMTA